MNTVNTDTAKEITTIVKIVDRLNDFMEPNTRLYDYDTPLYEYDDLYNHYKKFENYTLNARGVITGIKVECKTCVVYIEEVSNEACVIQALKRFKNGKDDITGVVKIKHSGNPDVIYSFLKQNNINLKLYSVKLSNIGKRTVQNNSKFKNILEEDIEDLKEFLHFLSQQGVVLLNTEERLLGAINKWNTTTVVRND